MKLQQNIYLIGGLFFLLALHNVNAQSIGLPPGDTVSPPTGDEVSSLSPDGNVCYQSVWVAQNLGEKREKKRNDCDWTYVDLPGIGNAQSQIENKLVWAYAVSNGYGMTGHSNATTIQEYAIEVSGLEPKEIATVKITVQLRDTYKVNVKKYQTGLSNARLGRSIYSFNSGSGYVSWRQDSLFSYAGAAYLPKSKRAEAGHKERHSYSVERRSGSVRDEDGGSTRDLTSLFPSSSVKSAPTFCGAGDITEAEAERLMDFVKQMWKNNPRKVSGYLGVDYQSQDEAIQKVMTYSDYVSSQPWIKNRGLSICPEIEFSDVRKASFLTGMMNGYNTYRTELNASAQSNSNVDVSTFGETLLLSIEPLSQYHHSDFSYKITPLR
jgi:hypothetical protein